MGRKTSYDPNTYPLLAEKYLREGMLDKDAAKKLGISQDTFYTYIKKYPEFSEAIKRGKAPVDFEVENKLLKRAMGYDHEETEREYKIVNQKKVLTKTVVKTKHVLPDVGAQAFWLKNRCPDKWRDRKDIDLSSKDGSMSPVDISNLSPEAKAEFLKLARNLKNE